MPPIGIPESLVLADFNGDGKVDLALGSDQGFFVTVALGNGDGTFSAGANYGLVGAIGNTKLPRISIRMATWT